MHPTQRAALEDAVREEIVPKNVAKLVRVPQPPKMEREPLTIAEVRQLLSATRDARLHAMYVVFALLGMRRSEVLGLMWDDVDLDSGTLRVERGLQRLDGKLTSSWPAASRRQLLQEVWSPAYGKETNYLRINLANLRRKLEAEPSRPVHLITEPGMGYRFVS